MAKKTISRSAIAGMAINASSIVRDRLAAFLGYSHSGARDLYTVFGYPREISVNEIAALYRRDGIANRIVRSFPQATWREAPIFSDGQGSSHEEGEDFSAFSKSVNDLVEKFKVLHYLERADRLSGMTQYSILVLGFKDGQKDLTQPLRKGNVKLTYIQPYSQLRAQIASWDTDPASERFGKPLIYNVSQESIVASNAPSKSFKVHWTRVIHIAEFCEEDDIMGTPRLQPIYNSLLDLQKVVGGSAETFWLCANRGIQFSMDENSTADDGVLEKVKEQAEELANSQRRYMVTQGVTANVLGAESPDPGPNAEKLLDIIAGASGIPKRILIGSERGELSSAQDENNWSQRIKERRRNYGLPMLLKPFIEMMIATGNVSAPQGKYTIEWDDSEALGPAIEADINLKKIQMIQGYVNSPGAEYILPPQTFAADYLGADPEMVDYTGGGSDTELDSDVPEDDPENDPQEIPGLTKEQLATNATAKSLYVCRKVTNGAAIIKWAKSQGFKAKDLLPVDELHVTICYSKKPIDWMLVGNTWTEEDDGSFALPAGGPRSVEHFGEDAVALEFSCHNLSWRHEDMIRAGAEHSYATYRPHITFASGDIPEGVEAYSGPIAFGPELFSEIAE